MVLQLRGDGWRSRSLVLQLRVSGEKGGARRKMELGFLEICSSLITHKPSTPTLISPWFVSERHGSKECVSVCACTRTSVFRLFANTVQPNRRQVTFCGGVCPVPMAEFVRSVPLDNKSCYRWQLKQVLHSL